MEAEENIASIYIRSDQETEREILQRNHLVKFFPRSFARNFLPAEVD